MVIILVGAQGLRKSSSVEALVPARDFFGILDLNKDDAARGRSMVGKLVMELGELRGFLNAKDEDGIKTFLAAGFDEWKPLYHERVKKHYRRCTFWATTDKTEFLSDVSGNRRYLPIKIKRTDVEGIQRDLEQLWAEAIERFQVGGVAYHVERVASDAHQQYMMSDLWDDPVQDWLGAPAEAQGFEVEGGGRNGDVPFRSIDLLRAIGVQVSKTGRSEQNRLARILQRLGYDSQPQWYDGKKSNVWVKR
jgi:predicted P-loop ATPase